MRFFGTFVEGDRTATLGFPHSPRRGRGERGRGVRVCPERWT